MILIDFKIMQLHYVLQKRNQHQVRETSFARVFGIILFNGIYSIWNNNNNNNNNKTEINLFNWNSLIKIYKIFCCMIYLTC